MEKLLESLGAELSPTDVRDYKLKTSGAFELPEEYSLEMVRVKSQGSVGSCVAHALSEIIEYYNKKQLNRTTEMSIVYIYGNRRTTTYQGEGMVVRDAIKAIKQYGDIPRIDCSGNCGVKKAMTKFEGCVEQYYEKGLKNRISAYVRLTSIEEVKTFLYTHGPIVMAMDWYKDIKVGLDGTLTSTYKSANKKGAHCMVIYGWDKTGLKILNSWSVAWGIGGTCIIPYSDFSHIREMWGIKDDIIEDDGTKDDIVKPFSFYFGKTLAKVINAVCNCFDKIIKIFKKK